LILLPLPTAPPYLLLLFLCSLAMHARPCFYCIVLLTALFVSSCYWQPLPIHSPLSTPLSDTIKTFADALNASAPSVFQSWQKPVIIKLTDRCWCDFSAGSLFEPFNLTRWELLSVERLRDHLVRKAARNSVGKEGQPGTTTSKNNTTEELAAPTPAPPVSKGAISTLRSTFWRAQSDEPPNASEVQHTSLPPSPPPSPASEGRPIAYGEFDLEPYGFDLILDFRWTRDTTHI
jgi:hypothetical protein